MLGYIFLNKSKFQLSIGDTLWSGKKKYTLYVCQRILYYICYNSNNLIPIYYYHL